ncbi:phosphopantetheine-binding protein [Paenibacillus cellulosilyticus]|uniref:phosphopantetheine-binding protein n=1 Tax=Paenibacillus cellulosilyticus TaxID=375489 RepID=UPI001FEAF4B1|nr:phosphopantetheine-binding protein [Paenibacillus cellulosilyticus]
MDQRYKQVLDKYVKVSKVEITGSESFQDLGIDSMSSINLLVELEELLGVEVAPELLTEDTFSSVGKLWDVFAGLLQQRSLNV